MYNEFQFEITVPGTPSTQLSWASGLSIGEHLELYHWAEEERLMVVDTSPTPSHLYRYEALEMIEWTETGLKFRHQDITLLANPIKPLLRKSFDRWSHGSHKAGSGLKPGCCSFCLCFSSG